MSEAPPGTPDPSDEIIRDLKRKVAELEAERDNAREYGKEARIRENKAEDARIHEQMLRHAAEAREARLSEALRNVRADCQSSIDLYHRVGPSFTSPGGDEYEPASYVMDKMQELVTRVDAALTGSDSGWVALPIDEAAKICARLEFDASWDKCGHGYYRLKKALPAAPQQGGE